MKFFIKDPQTGLPSEMVTLTIMVTVAATARFLLDGVSIQIFSTHTTFSHIDSMTYAAFLAPILGSHSFLKNKDAGGKNDDEK
jgi:hypothetical protein